ncbi:hypothetical protein F511_37997 [Dorcoceras hygrometricum]|uniref:Uncharacterized protein n=1 Tax=Dorcoceras hygrometricum TaxID=472368 RepID=A0A2Z7BQ59_9LAMI|nr:hypothetical protein F511_37997 [Dorcoceras hygrometricum]
MVKQSQLRSDNEIRWRVQNSSRKETDRDLKSARENNQIANLRSAHGEINMTTLIILEKISRLQLKTSSENKQIASVNWNGKSNQTQHSRTRRRKVKPDAARSNQTQESHPAPAQSTRSCTVNQLLHSHPAPAQSTSSCTVTQLQHSHSASAQSAVQSASQSAVSSTVAVKSAAGQVKPAVGQVKPAAGQVKPAAGQVKPAVGRSTQL